MAGEITAVTPEIPADERYWCPHKAQAHIDEKHAGAGEVVVGEDVAS